MDGKTLKKINWVTWAFCITLVGFTNHSRGEIVYRKLSVIAPENDGREAASKQPDLTKPPEEEAVRITHIQNQSHDLMTVLNRSDGLAPGAIMESQRAVKTDPRSPLFWVSTGLLKVEEIREHYALAKVLEDGSYDASFYFKESPGVMVGDRVVPQTINITQNIRLLPTLTMTYKDLFSDPKSFPLTFELSPDGLELLKQQARVFLEAHSPSLIVEAHTDSEGDRQTNQVESYQRALTIRQMLIDDLGFAPDRIIALGLGESEPLKEMYLPGKKLKARRIIIRANGHNPE